GRPVGYLINDAIDRLVTQRGQRDFVGARVDERDAPGGFAAQGAHLVGEARADLLDVLVRRQPGTSTTGRSATHAAPTDDQEQREPPGDEQPGRARVTAGRRAAARLGGRGGGAGRAAARADPAAAGVARARGARTRRRRAVRGAAR